MGEDKMIRGNLDKYANIFENVRSIAIFGSIGAGKTALGFKILSFIKDKDIYFISHPKPKLISELGYYNLGSIEDMERLQDCVIIWDEPQLSLNMSDYKRDRALARASSAKGDFNDYYNFG